MNVHNYRHFLELTGHKVVQSDSGYWFDIGFSFYEYIPDFAVISPSEHEIKGLFRRHHMLGIKYCGELNGPGKSSCLYICQDKTYDLQKLGRKTRRELRRAQKACTVHRVDFDYLCKHGMPLNQDTLARQKRDDPTFSQPAKWERFCRAASQVDGVEAWAAFVGDQLAAYFVIFIIEDYADLFHLMARTELLRYSVTKFLIYMVTKELISRPEINYICGGHESVRNLPGVDQYKVRLGHERRPVNLVVVLNPYLEPLLMNQLSDWLLSRLGRLLPDNDVLRRARGILDIAKRS